VCKTTNNLFFLIFTNTRISTVFRKLDPDARSFWFFGSRAGEEAFPGYSIFLNNKLYLS
jgi:hypothetical protein